ncbi:hypothetical protein [Actinomadura darangshiensis]|uniref:hypothetical protein n=1 Tax=Actinomadura darangshiensis TaxID=705336 RepID=UPI001FB699AC|nr:hypothetical protein [Actinomadura darangshiensis]
MAGENLTLRRVLWDVLVATAVTGKADPAPLNRPWPLLLRWTRYIGVGRIPYGIVTNLFGLAVTVGLIAGSYSLLMTEAAKRPQHIEGSTPALLIAIAVTAPLALRDRHPLGA